MKKKSISLILALTLVISLGTLATAANNDSITVNYSTSEIHELTTTGSADLDVSSATAGSAPDSVESSGITYALTTNDDVNNTKITAGLGADITETGVTLKVKLAPPTGGSGAPTGGDTYVDITNSSASAVDTVTGIGKVVDSGLAVTFELTATVGTGILGTLSETLTLTLTDVI